jgi:pimeloyl-ACP methyl ester carboxylesterase
MTPAGMLRVARFLHCYLRFPARSVEEREISLRVGEEELPASWLRPAGAGPLPGWILLHGITVPGRNHPVLTRFAHALASSGATVIIPEVAAWRRLRLEVAGGDAAIAAAAEHLRRSPDVLGERLNLVGFSFGATQALISASKPGIREAVRSVVGFGGYCDLGRTVRCMMTGEHEWNGVQRRFEPDPYGRWIIVGNFLTQIPEFAHMVELERAAHSLAVESGLRGAYAAEAEYDDFKARLREELPPGQRETWDLIAPPSDVLPPLEAARELSAKLEAAALRIAPELDPRPALATLDQDIVLAHGHDDRLIPYTETLRLQEALPPDARAQVWITRLFAHSREADRLGLTQYPTELGRYVALLNRALRPC